MKCAAVIIAVLIPVMVLAAAPAVAQREAVSATLSPEAAAGAFNDAVITACIPAVAGGGIGGLSAGAKAKLAVSSDPETRRQSGAGAGETVWDVLAGRGVVTIHEKAGRCAVSVYGPPAAATIMGLAQVLVNTSGFERLAAAPPPNGFGQTLTKTENGRRVMVLLGGSEPGTPGHRSRFSVVTATVFSAP